MMEARDSSDEESNIQSVVDDIVARTTNLFIPTDWFRTSPHKPNVGQAPKHLLYPTPKAETSMSRTTSPPRQNKM